MKKRIKNKKAKEAVELLRLAQIELEKRAAIKAKKDKAIIAKQIADRIKKGEERKIKLGLTTKTVVDPTVDFESEMKKHLEKVWSSSQEVKNFAQQGEYVEEW